MRAIDGGTWRSIATYAACVAGCVAVGVIASIAARDDGNYATLNKPAWAPSAATVARVWMLCHATMGIALAGVLTKAGDAGKRRAIAWFVVQLATSVAWGLLLFRWHSVGGAMIDAIGLWLLTSATVAACWSVRDWTGVVLMPCWAWATFAVSLNAAVWRLH